MENKTNKMDDKEYGLWTVKKLSEELKKRGVKHTGRKGDLVKRFF